jgi:hypothetical protein
MGLAYDHRSGNIYSCSTDKRFLVTELNYQDNVVEITTSSHGFTNLIYDKKNDRFFLSNEVGAILVYSVQGLNLLNTVQTTSNSSIRGLHVDYKKFYIFTATMDGKIGVLELGLPGKERFIKEIASFNGNKKVNMLLIAR